VARPRVLALVALVVVLLCSACRLDVDVRVTMAADGTGTVTVTATADADLVAKHPGALADLRLEDIKAAGWAVDGPAKQADGALRLTLTKPFTDPAGADRALAELNGPGGPLRDLHVARTAEFAQVTSTVQGQLKLDGGLAAFADADLVAALGGATPLQDVVTTPLDQALGVTFTAALPGTASSADGQVSADKHEVQWRAPLDGSSVTVTARFDQVDAGARSAKRRQHLATAALVVYLVVLAAVVVVVVLALQRRGGHRPSPNRSGPSGRSR
jgi:hypothetical protein